MGSSPSQPNPPLIRVGWVQRAHGLTGEVEVRLDWSESRCLESAAELYLSSPEGSEARFRVEAARWTPKGWLLRLGGVVDRTQAEALKGRVVHLERGELPELEPGEYYLRDLTGCQVFSPAGLLGVVTGVETYPSVDAIAIELAAGGRAEQPLLDEWIEAVDVGARRITLKSEDGLIESSSPAERPGAAGRE